MDLFHSADAKSICQKEQEPRAIVRTSLYLAQAPRNRIPPIAWGARGAGEGISRSAHQPALQTLVLSHACTPLTMVVQMHARSSRGSTVDQTRPRRAVPLRGPQKARTRIGDCKSRTIIHMDACAWVFPVRHGSLRALGRAPEHLLLRCTRPSTPENGHLSVARMRRVRQTPPHVGWRGGTPRVWAGSAPQSLRQERRSAA